MKRTHLIGVSLFALVCTSPAFAQAAPQSTDDTSGDIIVTATKREQTLQDVPISVSVTGAQTIERAQVRDLIDLQSIVPSLKVNQLNAVGQTNFIIRGFGNGNGNDGIESSVGVFIDGVYRSRSAAALDDLPEIDRIEVLRGPQSTLFGKNVSAGAISIVTKKPQFTFGGKAEISLGNYNTMQAKASLTGPLSDTVALRLSGSVNERAGYFRNSVTGANINDRNRWSVRADLLWQPSSDLSVRLIADYNLIREVCCGVAQVQNGPITQLIGLPVAAGGLGKPISDPTKLFNNIVTFDANPDNRVAGKGISGQVDWDIGFAKLTSITAYRKQENQSNQDIDFTGADLASNLQRNDITTFTQEFRLSSTGNGPLSWLLGGFYQDEKLNTGRTISFGQDFRNFANAQTGGAFGLIYALESLQAATNPSIVPGRTYFAQPGPALIDNYSMKQRSYSLFGQFDYKVTDRLTLSGGLAYLNDRKQARSAVTVLDKFSNLNLRSALTVNPATGQTFIPFAALPASISGCLLQKGFNPASTLGQVPANLFDRSLGTSLPGPGSAPCPASPAGTNPFALNALQFYYGETSGHAPVQFGNPGDAESGLLTGDKVTYAARAAYDFGAVNAYISYSTGWKAGAFNLSSDSRPPNAAGVGRTAAPEEVTVYEAGLKGKFRGGFFNLAVFQQSIKNFQSNPFNGIGYDLVNAGKESVRGFEVDAAYRPTAWLALSGAATYLDPKYDSFTGASCVTYAPCTVDPATGRRTRDLTGTKPAGIPTWSVTGSATLSHDFGNGLSAYLQGEYDWTSSTQLTETTPANLSTWGVSNVNASLGVADSNAQLEVMVWVRNLTDDRYLLGTFPSVAQQSAAEPSSYSGYPNQPRTYGVTLRKTF